MSIISLRDYQLDLIKKIKEAWHAGFQNVMPQLATGGGKTVIISHLLREMNEPFIVIAHRAEILSQLSLTLARFNLPHDIIAPKAVIRNIVRIHISELGFTSYKHNSPNLVASIDTVIKKQDARFKQIKIIVQDEGHHVLSKNKWGKAASMFSYAKGLYPTATPLRADGKGLGRNADGVIDLLIPGIPMRELINRGHLSEYRLIASPSDININDVPLSASGDYSPVKLRIASRKSHIVGDVVAHYLKIAAGKSGVTFAVDVESAIEIAASYRTAGVSAEVITAKTPDLLRASIIRKFRNREILQLVNVDLLGEGVDVPAIEVISMARPTQSYALYCQQFGRSLRIMPGKSHAIIIDHVGNWTRHGLPDRERTWTLERRERRSTSQTTEILKTCLNPKCLAVYERFNKKCPHCDYQNKIMRRSTPEQVDGDLTEISPEFLAQMRAEVAKIDGAPRLPQDASSIIRQSVIKRHGEKQIAQKELRELIALYAGLLKFQGEDDAFIYRKFYSEFHIDILSAQALKKKEAKELAALVKNVLTINNVVNK